MTQTELHFHLCQRVNAAGQFPYENGIVVTHVEEGLAKGVLTVCKSSQNPYGNVHGGALMAMADVVSGVCAASQGGRFVTSSSSVEFLRPATGKEITCIAKPKKMGRALPVIAVELFDDQNKLVCTGTFTFFRVADTNL